MAELVPTECFADISLFEREWIALRECVCPLTDKEQLGQYLTGLDCSRLLLLGEAHGVVGQLAACLNKLDAPLIPSEIRQTLLERQREQNFLTLRLVAELFANAANDLSILPDLDSAENCGLQWLPFQFCNAHSGSTLHHPGSLCVKGGQRAAVSVSDVQRPMRGGLWVVRGGSSWQDHLHDDI